MQGTECSDAQAAIKHGEKELARRLRDAMASAGGI
jgi:hypothetical protein